MLLLFAAGWYASAPGEDEAMTVASQDVASAPKQEKKPAGARVDVKGAALAAEHAELTDPFSFAHETKQQRAAHPLTKKDAKAAKDAAPAQTAKPPASLPPATWSPVAAAPAGGGADAQAPQEPPLVLKGVGISETDAVAVIIAYGQRRFVGIGDTIAGCTVTAIDRDSVTLTGDGGTTVLTMPSP